MFKICFIPPNRIKRSHLWWIIT